MGSFDSIAVMDGTTDAKALVAVWPALRESVTQAVDDLEPDFRLPLLLRHREKFSYAQIAQRLSLPEDGVRERVCAAAVRLHARLGMRKDDGLPELVLVSDECPRTECRIPEYVEGSAPGEERRRVEAHITRCQSCCETAARFRAVWNLLQVAYPTCALPPSAPSGNDRTARHRIQITPLSPAAAAAELATQLRPQMAAALRVAFKKAARGLSILFSRLGGNDRVPFWLVSLALHVLLIGLAGLISMSMRLSPDEERTTVVTELIRRPEIQVDTDVELPGALTANPEILAESESGSHILTAPDLPAQLSDHFETVNPDAEDLQSALGNEDARIIATVEGRVDAPGGGGRDRTASQELIGYGGGGFGKRKGFGGGKGTGIGLNPGGECGCFGQRDGAGRKLLVKKYGGTPATEAGVEAALQWLARQQNPDGHWGTPQMNPPVFCTSIATLAFLGAGHTERAGHYRKVVSRAVAWLCSQSKLEALDVNSTTPGYSLAAMTLALSEAAGMSNVVETRTAAQKAVDYCINVHQSSTRTGRSGWRYVPKQPGDLSVSGWFIMALKSAKIAGLQVEPSAFEGADRFLDSVQHKIEIKGADAPAGPTFEYSYMPCPDDHAASAAYGTDCCQAIANLCRQFLGYRRAGLQASIQHFISRYGVPVAGRENLYYWYYGTLCAFQQGGTVWENWNPAMQEALLSTQELSGADAGSWKPTGIYAGFWGRIGQTALGALSLEVYYRYSRLAEPVRRANADD
jgi:hypothetical protein